MSKKYNAEEIKNMVAGRVDQESELLGENEEKVPVDQELDFEFVNKCFMANTVGDSLLFNYLYRDKFACNDNSEEWMHYVGPHWEIDRMNRRTLAAIEQVVELYLEHLLVPVETDLNKLDQEDKDGKNKAKPLLARKKSIIERINILRGKTGRNNLLSVAATNADPLFLTPEQFDQNHLLFPCKNGVYDLEADEFRKGTPYDYLTSCSPYEFEGLDANSEAFEQYLLQAIGGDPEDLDCIHRHLGYAMTGLRTERMFMVFHGPHGQNGKGTLFETLNKVFGSLAGSIPTEMLMKQRGVRSPSGPSPELMDLKGKRVVWASETEDNQSFAHGLIKKFSGGDEIGGRGLQEKYISRFDPTHTLSLLCNRLPKAPAWDDAFWARIRVFRFPYSFRLKCTEAHHRKADLNLEKKLLAEGPGIIAWLIRGYKRYLKDGLSMSPNVEKASLEYRENEDFLQDFIDQWCFVDLKDTSTENRAPASSLYKKYKEWHEENNNTGAMNNKNFKENMALKGFKHLKSGNAFYLFLKLKGNAEASSPAPEGIPE